MLDCWLAEDGSALGPDLLAPLLEGKLRGCIIFGEPGSGKTTLLGQTLKAYIDLKRESSGAPAPVVLEFSHFHRKHGWWPMDGFGAAASEILSGGDPQVLFMDIPVPLLETTVRRLARREDVLVLALVSDPRIQRKAADLRNELRFGFGENVAGILRRHDIVSDLRRPDDVVAATFGMAPPHTIQYSSDRVLTLARGLWRNGVIDPASVCLSADEERRPEQVEEFRLKVAYTRHILRSELEVPAERGKVLLGTFRAGRQVHWYQAAIRRHAW